MTPGSSSRAPVKWPSGSLLVAAAGGLAGDDVEVVDDGDAAQVEQVLAGAAVAGAGALPVADVGGGMPGLDPPAGPGAPGGGGPAGAGVGGAPFVGGGGHAG